MEAIAVLTILPNKTPDVRCEYTCGDRNRPTEALEPFVSELGPLSASLYPSAFVGVAYLASI